MSRTVLVVDDASSVREALSLLLEIHGLEVVVAATPEQARLEVERGDIGVVLQDMNFHANATDGADGVRLFHELRRARPRLPIILMTAWADLQTAVDLVRRGADDYVAKPWDDDKLVAKVQALLEVERGTAVALGGSDELVHRSAAMRELVSLAERVATSDEPVLITGPNGSGKDVIARLIERRSGRTGQFVPVDAGALPKSMLEAELFGAEPGAYTGSRGLRRGRFEIADKGTMFLDEIGNLDPDGQAALLRVLETGQYQRLGGTTVRHADVRVLSATNADLHVAIEEGRFREDLYYRLAVFELRVPSLAERTDDILPLAEYFLAKQAADARLDPGATRAMVEHPWPGNVRELRNRVRRAALLRTGTWITAGDLGLDAGSTPATPQAARPPPSTAATTSPAPAPSDERQQVEEALHKANGVVSRAAAALGISRPALYRKMKRLGITLERRIT